jgi:hypothetical protein
MSDVCCFSMDGEMFENLQSEEKKVQWIITNVVLNGFGYSSYRATEDPDIPEYNYWEEAISWAKSDDYFPNLSDNELLNIFRKHKCWNEFEKTCVEMRDKQI